MPETVLNPDSHPAQAEALLRMEEIETGYGTARVLFGVDLSIRSGEAVSLLGRNGMGKTTLVKCLFGLLPARKGRIFFRQRELTTLRPAQRARAGLGLVPEGRQIFPTLTVEENLTAFARPGAKSGGGFWTLARAYDLFPELKARANVPGAVLSGGEQQMLAIARALMTNPSLLVLDEATEGLAPKLRRRIFEALGRIRDHGVALLVIDKHLHELIALCARHYILVKGKVVWRGDSRALAADEDARRRHLGV